MVHLIPVLHVRHKCERRRRDLNPRAATNGLLPFQGSPFSRLGTSAISWFHFLIKFSGKPANGEDGIRTHAPLRTNGFQDRLVMTTSIPLQTCFSILKDIRAFVKHFFLFFSTSGRFQKRAASDATRLVYHWFCNLSTDFYNFFQFFYFTLFPSVLSQFSTCNSTCFHWSRPGWPTAHFDLFPLPLPIQAA